MRFQLDSTSLPRIADGHVHIDVRGGYDPDTIVTRAGRPLRLTFTRHDTWPCADRVVFPDFGISVMLPPFEDVVVDLPAGEPGEHDFTCQMQMLHGRIVVDPEPVAR